MATTLYAVLGVPIDADEELIRSSYRALVRRYHPDAGPESSTEKFYRVVEAYQTLSDPRRREMYDRSLGRESLGVPIPVYRAAGAANPVSRARFEASPFEYSACDWEPDPFLYFDELFDRLTRAFFGF
jgi:curved DNA-binding protein CbpA